MTTFEALGLSDSLLKAVERLGCAAPTPIQTQAIPLVLEGRDVAAEAQTGSGKTAAFALPLLHGLGPDAMGSRAGWVRVLVLVPTRELALQVALSFQQLGEGAPNPAVVLAVIGGQPIEDQIDALDQGVDVVVATPGRLQELVDHREIDLGHVTTLVLDEADRLLALGFRHALDTLLEAAPANRQTLLFSATLPESVLAFCGQVLRDPVTVRIDAEPTSVATIEQRVFQVNRDKRRLLLQHLMQTEKWGQTLVFVATRRATETLSTKLRRSGVPAIALHGGLDQDERILALRNFTRGNVGVLIATDIAARGLDIEGLHTVVNFDLPRSTLDYTHRIGRTGRAGESGHAVSFIDHDSADHFRLIEKRTQMQLLRQQVPGFELQGEAKARKKGTGPVKGKRKSKKDKLREAAAKEAAALAKGPGE